MPGPSVFPSGEPGVSGDFWGSQDPLRPLRGLQETRVATREESGVLGVPSSQARILEWAAFPYSRGSFQPRDRIQVSCISRWVLYH